MEKKTFALLVGITDYQEHIALDNDTVYFPKLNGCVNDAKKIKSFLENNTRNVFISELYNEQATKSRICNTFLTHLGQAEKGDSILFYFSGHGTQEFADACFTTETDGKLESLVSYYSNSLPGDYLIADKELRYLINQVSKEEVDFTIIIDCCHSGDVTRNAEVLKTNYPAPVEKKTKGSYTFSQRRWSEFIFHPQFTAKDVKENGIGALLPERAHIVFSASESNESAYEINGEGIFTKHLADILGVTGGLLSNQELYERLALRMKYAYIQKPKLYTPSKSGRLKTSGFLNATTILPDAPGKVYYNQKLGWILNKGILSGLHTGLEEIELRDAEHGTQTISGKIEKINLDHTILTLSRHENPDRVFITSIEHLSRKIIKLYLNINSVIPKDALAIITAVDQIPRDLIDVVGDESNADFVLHHLQGIYYLSRPHDSYRPISEGVAFSNHTEIIEQLKHLSSWKFINELTSTTGKNLDKNNFLKLEYALQDKPYTYLQQNEQNAEILINEWSDSPEGTIAALKIKITNVSEQGLYVSILYLDINYSSTTFLLEPSPYFLDAGNSVELNVDGDPLLTVEFPRQALYYNNERYTERIKIIVSDTPFDVYPLKLETLPEPPLPGMETLRGIKRGIRTTRSNPVTKLEGWFISNLDLINVNPHFNRIPAARIKEMLNDKVTTAFAEGLFFMVTPDDSTSTQPFAAELRLKSEIVIVKDDPVTTSTESIVSERGFVVDIANWWARRKRNDYYENIVRRFPERIKIVSEGDSWFQHPLVYDTIDHLSKIYAIRCVAAAADTLSNYLSGATRRGEYFLDVLRTVKPSFFLISGGGNDILGSQFRNFLVEKPYTSGLRGNVDGSKFLKESFTIEIDKLMNIYSSIFLLLESEFPTMKTIIHGYDYPVHLDSTDKGWLGRYMIEKGITDAADRRVVIKYIMDEFNDGLSAVVNKFPDTVRYLDLRNTVVYKAGEIDQWYDEIHPNIDGFQLIALKYIKLIERLKQPQLEISRVLT